MTNEQIAAIEEMIRDECKETHGISGWWCVTANKLIQSLRSERELLLAETKALERAAEYGANNSPLENINKEFLLKYFREVKVNNER